MTDIIYYPIQLYLLHNIWSLAYREPFCFNKKIKNLKILAIFNNSNDCIWLLLQSTWRVDNALSVGFIATPWEKSNSNVKNMKHNEIIAPATFVLSVSG